MLALDVNVIVSAVRQDAPDHEAVRSWLEAAVADPEPVGISDAVLTGALQILTHPRVFNPPTPLDHALSELGRLRDSTGVVRLVPGPGHWARVDDVCRGAEARGSLVADAAHAALAMEHGCTMISKDGDFARFSGLRWRRPTAP